MDKRCLYSTWSKMASETGRGPARQKACLCSAEGQGQPQVGVCWETQKLTPIV